MVLNIESCSEGREEETEEEEGRGSSSSRNWMGSRASVLLGQREGESCIVALGTLNLLTKLD